MTNWSGNANAAAVAASASNLTTVAKVQALPGVDSSWTSAQITVAIGAASEAIARYCDRVLEAATYRTWMDGVAAIRQPGYQIGSGTAETLGYSTLNTPNLGEYITLREYPIISLYRVATNADQAVSLTNSSTGMTWSSATAQADGVLLLTVVGGANAGTSTLTLSAYSTMALLVTAIEALATGWDATVILEGEPASIRPGFTTSDPGTGLLYLYQPGSDAQGYVPRLQQGILQRPYGWPAGPGSIYVHYRAGYSTIPADLEMVANMLTVDLLTTSTSDSRITAEKIGNLSYSYSAGTGGLIKSYEAALRPYRRVSI